jgi:type I restriction enzyme, R subunit
MVEFDYLTAKDTHLTGFPTPAQLWSRLQASRGIGEAVANRMLTPFHHGSGKNPLLYHLAKYGAFTNKWVGVPQLLS